MTENLQIWNKYKEVPQNALKPFDNGTFKGTDINTMWRMKCLTDEFGPCGIGWYPELVNKWTEMGADGEILCFVEIKLYIKYNGEWSKGISATGGSKLVSYVKSKDYHKNSDEGYKMAFTDAVGVACKCLGFGADVYWENDRTKYNTDDDGNPKNSDSTSSTGSKQQSSSEPPTLEQLAALQKIKRGIPDVAKALKIREKAVTKKHVAAYIAQAIAYQKEKEAKQQAELDAQLTAEALDTFGGGDDE